MNAQSTPETCALRVLVVDDHGMTRTGIANLIDAERPRMCCVGVAGDAAGALEHARRLRPDVVVLDALLADDDGLALIPALLCVARRVVVLSSLLDRRVTARARQLGAMACVHKTAPADELLRQIAACDQGERPATESITP